ncbi:MAG: hypothetical protein JZU60_04755, partial [Ilumatobacteraceae bacterium]|nr:hypothetical protein [Ilumatobacteraceae bacterium]
MKLVRSFLGVLFSLLALLLTGCGGGGGGGDDDTSAIPNGNGTEVWAFKDSQYSSNIATLTLNKSGTAPATATVELSYYDSDYGVRISGTVTGKATVTSSTIYLDTSGNLKANSGESGQCRVIFDGKLENGYASGHGSVNCPSTGAGAYSTSGSWNGMRSSGSGVTSPTITSTVAARSNANPNLPTSADTTLGSFNSYMPLTVGSTLKYSVTAGSVTAD